jgi:Protein of unknown function (DUF1585)/Protein of unknown function (DUF1592)
MQRSHLHRRLHNGSPSSQVGVACMALAVIFLATSEAQAIPRTLEEYRYFRALSVDLTGDIPSLTDLASFERDGFDLNAWIDQKLTEPRAAQRLARVYTDPLRLALPGDFSYPMYANALRRVQVRGPDGRSTYVYYRPSQRRTRRETDANTTGSNGFCLTVAERGTLDFDDDTQLHPSARTVDTATLDRYTRTVAPWWLYADHRAATPTDRYDRTRWRTTHPLYELTDSANTEPDGRSVAMRVRVCAEETQTAERGARIDRMAETVTCRSGSGTGLSAECGCGVGLEWCIPTARYDHVFRFPHSVTLGLGEPFESTTLSNQDWTRLWWAQEAQHFIEYVFAQDRDVRDLLRAPYTVVNGPAAQFYQASAQSRCCSASFLDSVRGSASYFGLFDPEPLFDPQRLPRDLSPTDVTRWVEVPDRGPHASGILTMPVFLTKYGSRRQRAHALYRAFLCREFVAENVTLAPSSEPDLTRRPGCSTCHTTLEPLSAYFARVFEGDMLYWPAAQFPIRNPRCVPGARDYNATTCGYFYDPDFVSPAGGLLWGAYANPSHVDQGPRGLAEALVTHPDFAGCVVQNVASSLLGRALNSDDAALKTSLTAVLVGSGYHPRALVRAIVRSDAYQRQNNLNATTWREQHDAGVSLDATSRSDR